MNKRIALPLLGCLLVAAEIAATGAAGSAAPGRVVLPEPIPWNKAVTTNHALLRQPFVLDGVQIRIDRVAYVATMADGTPADEGARIVEVDFRAHNPEPQSVHFFDRFYAYAVMSDGSNTDGEGLSFFLPDSSKELLDFSLKPGEEFHGRFDMEIPDKSSIAQLVLFGPVDGATVSITQLNIAVLRALQ